LEYLIEHKILEVLGDPDSGLELSQEFKQELKGRLENPSRRISLPIEKELLKSFMDGVTTESAK
jgi:hypothetical protein